MRIYLDTCVIIDFLMDRDSDAYRLLKRGLECEFSFVISRFVIEELQRHVDETKVILAMLAPKLEICPILPEDRIQASGSEHYGDMLHYLTGRRHADFIVTKNVAHFPKDRFVRRPDEI